MSTLANSSPRLGKQMLSTLDDLAMAIVKQRDKGILPPDAAEGILQSLTEARNMITSHLLK